MRTEKEIFKEFEKLGYTIDNDKTHCYMENEYKKKILINKKIKMFTCCKPSWCCVEAVSPLFINEFKLLHELFELWGWLEK